MRTCLKSNLRLFLLLFAAAGVFSAPTQSLAQGREDDPRWEEFVVGKVTDLPKGPVRDFITNAHWNNPYAATIAKQTKKLGPFAPEQDNVFWIPTIEMPIDRNEWRFLSSMDDVPTSVLKLATVKRGGQIFVRMFLHPYSVLEPSFTSVADRFGGFKFEFQATTTASVRSLIAWKAAKPKPLGEKGELSFPTTTQGFLWPKVSITKADIDGSRLNPAKKMVRAFAVTRAMDAISDKTKEEVGFQFAGEWVVGVPKGTDAGYVAREVLPAYTAEDGTTVEPGFSVLSPRRLTELVKGLKDPARYIQDKLLRPVIRVIAYLMMEEGMVGEYHNQNFNYRIGKNGKPTGEVLLHDADAFRTSIQLRVVSGKETATLRKVDAPFFYMKDSVFSQTDAADEEYGLNSLVHDYFSRAAASDSVAGFIKTWCSKIRAYKDWCTNQGIEKMFMDTFSEELEPYVGHKIENLDFASTAEGKVGLLALFKERLEKVAAESKLYRSEPDVELQKTLLKEFERLTKAGKAKALSGSISLENTKFYLEVKKSGATIHAVAKDADHGKLLKGIAVLALSDDPEAIRFAERVKKISKIEIPMDHPLGIEDGVLTRPWMIEMGGGSNIPTTVRAYINAKEKRSGREYRRCDPELLP